MEDFELAEKVKTCEDEYALLELMDRHEAMFHNVVQKYSKAFVASGVYKPDVVEDKNYIFYKTAKSFNPEKSKFSTWLGNYTRYECLNRISKSSKYVHLEEENINTIEKTASKRSTVIQQCLEEVSKLSDSRMFKIFKLRYVYESKKPPTWKSIAQKLGLSTQTALNIHNKTIKFLQKKKINFS